MVVRSILTCSGLAMCCLGFADFSAGEWVKRLETARAQNRLQQELRRLREVADEEGYFALVWEIDYALENREYDDVSDYLRAMSKLSVSSDLDANEDAKRILSGSAYRDEETGERSNWLSKALRRLKQLVPEQRESSPQAALEPPSTVFDPGIIIKFFTIAIVAAVAIFLALALRNSEFGWWKKKAGTKRVGLLLEDEEVGSFDEWLQKADRLEAEGRYREAVRCLYLAILLRLDEENIARFDRYETNWEHLVRIERSSAPEGIGYRAITKRFDYIWYGEEPASAADCAEIRTEYLALMDALRRQGR